MDPIISAHYLGKVDPNFVINVLHNESSSFSFKRNVLFQIIDEKQYSEEIDKLRKLNSIRNIFAHAGLKIESGKSPADPKAKVLLINPKKADDYLDPNEKLDEFNKLFPVVFEWLKKMAIENGVPIPPFQPPKKLAMRLYKG